MFDRTSAAEDLDAVLRLWNSHGWSDAAAGAQTVVSLFRCSRLMSQRIDALLRPLELSFARYEILMLLSFSKTHQMSITKIGALLQVHPTSVSSAADRLEKSLLAKRLRSEGDKRIVRVLATELGLKRALEATELLNRQVFEPLGVADADVGRLLKILSSFRANAGDFMHRR